MSFLGAGTEEEPSDGAFRSPAPRQGVNALSRVFTEQRCRYLLHEGRKRSDCPRFSRRRHAGFLLPEEYADSAALSAPSWSFFIPTLPEPRCPVPPCAPAAIPSLARTIIPRIASARLVTPQC